MAKNPFVGEYGELSTEILLNVAELLALRLPEGTERIIASKWVKKFNKCGAKEYQNNLSLFVSCLTKQLLVDPFDKPPKDMTNQWTNFDKIYTQRNINDAVIHRLYLDSFTPPYEIDLSSDMNEYVTFQEIPFFGAHFYYAFAPRDRIDKWSKFNKMNVPKSFVDILRKDDPLESPVKGRLFPRPVSKISEANIKIGTKLNTPKAQKLKKPEWEDLIPQDESVPEPEKKPTIVIPTDVPVRNIPPALQRRMAKAEQERQERLSKKAQEQKERLSRLAAPKRQIKRPSSASKTPSRPTSKKQPQKSIKGVRIDDIDANLMSQQPKRTIIPPTPKSPEFTGPHADVQRRLLQLRQSNMPPSELIKTTRDITQTSADINKEAKRLQRDGTANLKRVEELRTKGLSVGARILNMMKECQADEIQKQAEITSAAVANVRLTMDQLNDMLEEQAANRETHEDALERLNEIKERMQNSAIEAQNISIRINGMKMGHELMDMMDEMINVGENSAQQLQNIDIETEKEGILIEGLENGSQQLVDSLQLQRDRLSRALENNEPALLPLLDQAVKTVDEILSNSINENIQLTENVERTENAMRAIEIDAKRNELLDEMNSQALQILNDVEFAVSKIMDVSGDLIDIDNEDLGFSDVMDENEMERQRQLKLMERQERMEELQQRMQLIQIDDNEDLAEISAKVIDGIEDSITEIDNVLIPGLQKLEINVENPKDREVIHQAIETVEEEIEALNESLIEMRNLNESLGNQGDVLIDYDLIDLEDDLIQFD